MEIKREPLQAPTDFRSRQLQARDMLRGDLEDEALQRYVEQAVMTTTLDKAVAWARYAIAAGLVLALLAGWMWRARSGAKLELQPVASMTARPPLEQVKTPPMTARIVRKHAPKRAPAFKSEPLVVKMITDDPDVVIYWLVDQNGG